MKQSLVSVIVPVYKVEPYLAKCLDSIINQTYKNLEIILVDDGSPDNCGKMCDEYAQKDARIKVIHKKNGGLSSARNTGLDIAKGEYIAFVDSDDYIAENMYEDLVSIAKKEQADIVMCAHYNVYKDRVNIFEKSLENSGAEEIKYQLMADNYPNSPWNKIYKKEIFKSVRFPINILYEDVFIIPMLLLNAQKIIFTPKSYYFYNHTNENSITALPINAKVKYGLFQAWAEHERVAKIACEKAYKISQTRAIRYAVRGLSINMAKQSLTQQEVENCENYLNDKKSEKLAAEIGAKYKILWWSLDNCPLICELFGKFTIWQRARKIKLRKNKELV